MKIALLGYGKMGREIERLALADGHAISHHIDADNRSTLSAVDLSTAEVAIDFSRPDAAVANIDLCLEAGLPLVVGTTGWYDELGAIRDRVAAADGALFHATNFSIGVQLFFRAAARLSELMKPYDYTPTIQETHHTEKLDAPSGTALTLADRVGEALDEPPPIESFRESGVPGTHLLRFAGPVDHIELTHTARSREGFARGALTAARWLLGKRGVFTMDDLLNDARA